MIYYRIAAKKQQSSEWEWKSTILNSLEAVFRLGQQYSFLPAEQVRVFMASSVAYMDILLVRENLGLASNSITLDQLLHARQSLTTPQVRRLELELGWRGAEAPALLEQALASPSVCEMIDAPMEQDPEPGGGDHDIPYIFAFPDFLPHILAWFRLRERVLAGELVP